MNEWGERANWHARTLLPPESISWPITNSREFRSSSTSRQSPVGAGRKGRRRRSPQPPGSQGTEVITRSFGADTPRGSELVCSECREGGDCTGGEAPWPCLGSLRGRVVIMPSPVVQMPSLLVPRSQEKPQRSWTRRSKEVSSSSRA